MTSRKPANRLQIEEQIRVHERRLAGLEAERDALLVEVASEPDNEGLHRSVEGYNRDIANVSMRITILRGSLTEAGRQVAIARHAEHLEFLAGERQRVGALGAKLTALGGEIIELAEKLGPLLQRYEQLATERGAAAWTVLREGSTLTTRHGIQGHASMREGPLPLAIEAAFYHSGLGRVGPRARIAIEPPAPAFGSRKLGGEWIPPVVANVLPGELARAEQRVAYHLDQALASAKGA